MDTLFSRPIRNVNNQIISVEDILLSDYMDVYILGSINIRIVIESLESGASIILVANWNNGTVNTGVFNKTIDDIGSYEIAFSRADIDINTLINASIQVIGRMRMGFEIIAFARNEDILQWP